MKRHLRQDEICLLRFLLARRRSEKEIEEMLRAAEVEDMADGGMGSLKFFPKDAREQKFGTIFAEAEFFDEDGVVVSLALNSDDHGGLLELDLWKVDFSPLKRFPVPSDLNLLHTLRH